MHARRDLTVLLHGERTAKGKVKSQASGPVASWLKGHPKLQAYLRKVQQDNLRFLVAAVSWNLLIAVPEIAIGVIAVVSLFFRSPSQQRVVVQEVSRAVQGVLKPEYLERLVRFTMQNRSLTLVIGIIAVAWAADNVGSAITQCFEAMFEVKERSFWQARMVHLSMFLVSVVLLLLIAAGTNAMYRFGLASPIEFAVRTVFTLLASFVLFAVTYIIYPNTEKRFTVANVWRGALPAAVMFQILTFIWPLSAAYLSSYGGILVPLFVLTAWVYSFSLILLVGAEILAISAIEDAEKHGQEIGPRPDRNVPQQDSLRQEESGRQHAQSAQ